MGDAERVDDGRGIPAAPVAIPAVEVPQETRQLRFSFKHLDATHAKFLLTTCNAAYLQTLLDRIRVYSGWTVEDFRDQNNGEHRHVIFFDETSEPNGFTGLDPDQLAYHEAWQFELRRDEDWRVHGILIDDTFYVVWLDFNHSLYPRNQQRA